MDARIQIKLSSELKAQVVSYCETYDMTVSELIRELLMESVTNNPISMVASPSNTETATL